MSADSEPTRALEVLVVALQTLALDPSFQAAAGILSQVRDLREENARLSSSNRGLLEEYRKFRNELEDDKSELIAAKTSLEQIVLSKEGIVKELREEKNKLVGEVTVANTALGRLSDIRLKLEGERAEVVAKADELYAAESNLNEELLRATQKLEEQLVNTDIATQELLNTRILLTEKDVEIETLRIQAGKAEETAQQATSSVNALKEILS